MTCKHGNVGATCLPCVADNIANHDPRDAKRIAEYRHRATLGSWTTIDSTELLQLVECYEAARAWAKSRSDFLRNDDTCAPYASASYVMMNEAGDRLRALFPEAGNG